MSYTTLILRNKGFLASALLFSLLLSSCAAQLGEELIQEEKETQTAAVQTAQAQASQTPRGQGAALPAIPGASDWTSQDSEDYAIRDATIEDASGDTGSCEAASAAHAASTLLKISGLDIVKVIAEVKQEAKVSDEWQPLVIFVLKPLGAAADENFFEIQMEWEINNSLGRLTVSKFGEIDGSAFNSAAPTMASWSNTDTGELGIDFFLPEKFGTPNEAAEALVPWFIDLSARVRTETEAGPVCDEVPG